MNTAILASQPQVRVDPNVDFTWGTASPMAGIPADNFSVRWTGQVTPQFTETYTFYVNADDGFQLWIAGVSVIERWATGSGETSGTIALTAGQRVDVRLEYFDATGSANVRLSWSSPSQTKQVVPAARLSLPVYTPGALSGDYFVDQSLGDFIASRDDGPISFNWTSTGPGSGFLGVSGTFPYTTYYSVRWTGSLVAPATGSYTFFTLSDDGVRLWVNGTQLVNNWTSHSATENSGTISLTAGQRVFVRLDYQQLTVDAVIALGWQGPGIAKQTVPASTLNPQ